MRIILLILLVTTLRSQNANKTALTAGSEFSNFTAQEPGSITSGYQIIDYQSSSIYRYPPTEPQLSGPQTRSAGLTNAHQNNLGIYFIVFLLTAIALFFIITKNRNKTLSETMIHLEPEENAEHKKQMWTILSESPPED